LDLFDQPLSSTDRFHAPVAAAAAIFRPVFDAPLRGRHRNQTRHRDVMWTAVLLCACATAAAVTSLSDDDGDGTPGQAWVDDRVSGHPVGYIGRRHEFLTLCPVRIYCP